MMTNHRMKVSPLMDNIEEVPIEVMQWELAFFSSITGQSCSPADPRFPAGQDS
jgi:hypothetical protein